MKLQQKKLTRFAQYECNEQRQGNRNVCHNRDPTVTFKMQDSRILFGIAILEQERRRDGNVEDGFTEQCIFVQNFDLTKRGGDVP